MPYDKKALIDYRIQRARETVQEAEMSLNHNRFNLAENRIYYSMFYMVQALAAKHDFSTSKHAQLLGWFNKTFVRTGQIDPALGKFYHSGFEKRQEGDYQDFLTFSKDEVENDLANMI
ncbi:MAG: HEPN domain-containing protein, partial [Lentisphaerae bacterium]|nr:HEPN domain-containing protein [Lentisphaerota bacterium]